jgi:hypothetical protein
MQPMKNLNLRCFVAAGAGANSDITVTGIKLGDQIVSVIEAASAIATLDNERSALTTITADGIIRISASTSGKTLIVIWNAATQYGPQLANAVNLKTMVVRGALANASLTATGLKNLQDQLALVIEFQCGGTNDINLALDVTASCYIYADDVMRCSVDTIHSTYTSYLLVLYQSPTQVLGMIEGCNLKSAVVTGLNATQIVVTGIVKATDKIQAVFQFSPASAIAVLTDITSTFSINADGYILGTGDSSSNRLWVLWNAAQ